MKEKRAESRHHTYLLLEAPKDVVWKRLDGRKNHTQRRVKYETLEAQSILFVLSRSSFGLWNLNARTWPSDPNTLALSLSYFKLSSNTCVSPILNKFLKRKLIIDQALCRARIVLPSHENLVARSRLCFRAATNHLFVSLVVTFIVAAAGGTEICMLWRSVRRGERSQNVSDLVRVA